MMENIDEILKKLKNIKPFSSLDDLLVLKIIRNANYHEYRTHKALYYQGDSADFIYLILSGTVKNMIYREDCSSLVINKSAPGDWLGITETMLNTGYLFDSIAEETTETLCFSKNDFVNLLENSSFSKMVILQISKMNHNLVQNLNVVSPLQKIVKFLLAKVELGTDKQETAGFQIETTQENIAEIIGYSRETVNKTLKVLESRQLILVRRNLIEVINLEGLRNIKE